MTKQVLLLQLDGKLPNLALMRIAQHHRAQGDVVQLRQTGNAAAIQPRLGDEPFDAVFASLIFERTKPLAEYVLQIYPNARIGGTGWDTTTTVADVGVDPTGPVDYSDYPRFTTSMGFTQRGCRLRCSFCVVPKKEGAVAEVNTIAEIWRGEPWPKHLLLLDNDFFGQPNWRQRIDEIKRGSFRVSFNQGINARMINDDTAAAIASVNYSDDNMTRKTMYTAWDNRKDERRLFAGLDALVRSGVKRKHLIVYMLCGYWPNETHQDRDYRRKQLRAFGCLPYPMPYTRTPELVGFQRWVLGHYDQSVDWQQWKKANYEPRKLFFNRTRPAKLPIGEL